MRCAVCKSELESIELFDVTLDQCPFCHALWFDNGELESYSDNHKPLEFMAAFNGPIFTPKRPAQSRDCPRCESTSLRFGSVSRYDVWRCEKCRGYFVFSETLEVLDSDSREHKREAFTAVDILLKLLSLV